MVKKTTTEYYRVEAGELVQLPNDKDELFAKHGRVPPEGGEVVALPPPKWWKSNKARRIAVYPENGSRAWPLSTPKANGPKELSPADVINLFGPYLSGLLTRALRLAADAGKFQAKDWLLLIVTGLSLILSGTTLGIVVKVFRDNGMM